MLGRVKFGSNTSNDTRWRQRHTQAAVWGGDATQLPWKLLNIPPRKDDAAEPPPTKQGV